MSRFQHLPIMALLALMLAACGGDEATQPQAPTTAVGGATHEDPGQTAETITSAPPAAATEHPDGASEPTAETTPTSELGGMAGDGDPGVRADELAAADVTVGLALVADGFVHPLVFTHANDDSGRMFIADQTGVIYVMSPEGEVNLSQPFLDLRDRLVQLSPGYDERGLLGLAFHPDYASNGRFFVYYSAPLRNGAPAGWNHTSHVSEFTVSPDNPDQADAASERIVMQVDQPQANHNGGQIAFGPDGYLYIPLGDGGSADDNDEGHVDDWYEANGGGNGQDVSQNLLGSILRIDVDSGDPYGIPADNPFADDPQIGAEQWAWGFRNPYRISFDRGGDNWLFVGDAGQNLWEEVSVVQSGGNYGWNVLEGSYCFSTDNASSDEVLDCPRADPDGNPLINPVVEFRNINQLDGIGLTVVGGNVYRGRAISALEGTYVFASWSSSWGETKGQLFVVPVGALDGGAWQMFALPTTESDMGLLSVAILSFGEDADGELYVLTTGSIGPQGTSGQIWRIIPAQ